MSREKKQKNSQYSNLCTQIYFTLKQIFIENKVITMKLQGFNHYLENK